MRVRAQDVNGDYTFGQGSSNFLIDSPDAVAQTVLTRLRLLQGEWWLDSSVGTPYAARVLGKRARPTYDDAIRTRIRTTFGVNSILSYSSQLSPARVLTITATIDTIYGATMVSTTLAAQASYLLTEGGSIITTEGGTPLTT